MHRTKFKGDGQLTSIFQVRANQQLMQFELRLNKGQWAHGPDNLVYSELFKCQDLAQQIRKSFTTHTVSCNEFGCLP